jgi:hypothetical protein
MAQGTNGFSMVFGLYVSAGVTAVLLRLSLAHCQRHVKSRDSKDETRGSLQCLLSNPLVPVVLILLGITVLLPPNPWRHLTATLGYNIVGALSKVMLSKIGDHGRSGCDSTLGSHPLGTLNYNPADDPFYITNLDQPVDEFIRSALEDAKFTNIVHIVLESMREDSYPFQEDGLLNQHIKNTMKPVEGGTPVNTQTITPFIASLAEHTISWHTLWTTIPYTHKAMLACTLLPMFKLT